MKARKPLFSDPELRSELRADLNEYARATTRYDVERGAAAFASALAALGTASQASALEAAKASAEPSALNPAAGKLAMLPAVKASLAVVGCALVGFAAFQFSDWRSETSSATRAAVTQPHSNSAVPSSDPDQAHVQSAAAPTPSDSIVSLARSEAGPTASRREIESLLRIRELLPRDPGTAYRLARAAQQEFPSGALSEEREGLTIIALFSLGDGVQARREAARFIARYPTSPLRERIERLAGR